LTALTEETRRSKRRPRKITWRFYAIIALILASIVLLTAGTSIYRFLDNMRSGQAHEDGVDLPKPKPGEKVNILIIGIDVPVDGKGNVITRAPTRSDTIILATVDKEKNEAELLSIPRDTRVRIPERSGYDKANAAHAYGGPSLLVKTIEGLLDVPIHYYVRTNVDGFSAMIDILGGVDINVEKDMEYVDIWQDLVINLKAGQQILDGDKAMQYVRYRGDGDDITRIHRQQKFIQAVKDKMLRPSTILKLPRMMSEATKYIDTNMEPGEILSLSSMLLTAGKDALSMDVLPGYPNDYSGGGISYWMPDVAKVTALMDKVYRDIDVDLNATIKIEILNGTTRAGIATEVAKKLAAKGFQVINTGNADNTKYKLTKVIDRSREAAKLDALVKVFEQGKLFSEPGADSGADITIVLGADYQS
jgi:polyisoprenyl-teichoic acid--peptidoglycan teichoic acid transferase